MQPHAEDDTSQAARDRSRSGFDPRPTNLDVHGPPVDWNELGRRILAEAARRTMNDLWREHQGLPAIDAVGELPEETS